VVLCRFPEAAILIEPMELTVNWRAFVSTDRIIIIGAGMAGASAAYFLTRKGVRNIRILEKEKIAGTQSTGRNAAILRTMIPDPLLNQLARESAEFYHNPPAGFSSEPLVDKVGVYLAATAEHAQTLQKWCTDNPEAKLEQVDPSRLYNQVPILAPGLEMVTFQGDDGVMDVHAILQGFIRGACHSGAQLCLGCEFLKLRTSAGRVTGVETSDGFLEASKIIVANGGWASVADTFEAYTLPFTPHRRHLLVTEVLPQINPRWPVVWIVGEEFYFRPESGGLLMCGCDAVKVTPEQGSVMDPSQLERIASKASRWLPSLADARVAKAWAGMRTFVPDDLFVIGSDPRLQGLYWVAGLGGHGITCAPIVGALAADWIVDGGSSHAAAMTLSPNRLVQ
jgi:D-arginine dehydrogenase